MKEKPKPPRRRKAAAPSPGHMLFKFWSPSAACFALQMSETLPHLRIKKGAIVYAKSVKPQAGDMIVCPVEGFRGEMNVTIGRFIRGDGFRLLMEIPGRTERILVAKDVFVVHSIAGGDE